MTPEDIRVAKSAASAVRMSLDLLSLDVELLGGNYDNNDQKLDIHGKPILNLAASHKHEVYTSMQQEKGLNTSVDTSKLFDEVRTSLLWYNCDIDIDLFKWNIARSQRITYVSFHQGIG